MRRTKSQPRPVKIPTFQGPREEKWLQDAKRSTWRARTKATKLCVAETKDKRKGPQEESEEDETLFIKCSLGSRICTTLVGSAGSGSGRGMMGETAGCSAVNWRRRHGEETGL